MPKAALAALLAASTYATAFHSPGPALTRVAPDRAEPRQRVLSVGFWGASADLQLVGPTERVLYDPRLSFVPEPYVLHAFFDAVLRNDQPQIYAEVESMHRRGFLRMIPSIWYGVRRNFPDRFVGDGRVALSGRFFWFPARRPEVPEGWRVESARTHRIRLTVDYTNSGSFGGGVPVTFHEPRGWHLADIRIDVSRPYIVDWEPAWRSPLSTGNNPTLPDREKPAYEMFPEVWAEVTDATLMNPATGERRTTETPTGWIEAAGRFQRRSS